MATGQLTGGFSEHPTTTRPTGRRGFLVVRLVLGTLLLVAAGLKADGVALGPFGGGSFLESARLQVATIEVEVLLGLWLLTGWAARLSWAAALAFFVVLAGASLTLALAGKASCSCFGRLTVNPWLTFGLDVGAVVALSLCRPKRWSGRFGTGDFSPVLKVLSVAGLLLALVGGGMLLVFGGPAEALAWFRGEAVTVSPAVADVGKGSRNEGRSFQLRLTNRTDRPIRVVGGTNGCACVATKDLPLALGPKETASIEVTVRFGGSPGYFRNPFLLYTDDEGQPHLVGQYSGVVVAADE